MCSKKPFLFCVNITRFGWRIGLFPFLSRTLPAVRVQFCQHPSPKLWCSQISAHKSKWRSVKEGSLLRLTAATVRAHMFAVIDTTANLGDVYMTTTPRDMINNPKCTHDVRVSVFCGTCFLPFPCQPLWGIAATSYWVLKTASMCNKHECAEQNK